MTELECLAVVWAINKFAQYVEFSEFIIETDHQVLQWLLRLTEPKGRLARWILQLQGQNFTVKYRRGCSNTAADALSRRPIKAMAISNCNKGDMLTWNNLIQEQHKDVTLSQVICYVTDGTKPKSGKECIKIERLAENCLIDKGLLVKYFPPKSDQDMDTKSALKIVIPQSLRFLVIQRYHDPPLAGHLKVFKTYKRIQTLYTWEGMKRDIVRYVRSCEICQACKPATQKPIGLMIPTAPLGPWEMIGIDLWVPIHCLNEDTDFSWSL